MCCKKGHFSTWPGLTTHLINRHLAKNIHTEQGHLRQEQQNLQSTNYKNKLREIQAKLTRLKSQNPDVPLQQLLQSDSNQDFFPPSDALNIRTNCVIYQVFSTDPTGLGYTDLTGRFPYCSSRGNEYIFLGYHYDANAILALPNPNRQAPTLVNTWKTLHKKILNQVLPQTHIFKIMKFLEI